MLLSFKSIAFIVYLLSFYMQKKVVSIVFFDITYPLVELI